MINLITPAKPWPSPSLAPDPSLADDSKHQRTLKYGTFDMLAEINAHRDCIDIKKHLVLSELEFQPIKNSSRDIGSSRSTIGDEALCTDSTSSSNLLWQQHPAP